ncbi:MAG: hypothetical protein EBS90_10690 [Betaproteobacteria bacterium]|nr:hypothetical protein [Betaproteobacteria bacterium]
MIRGVLHALFSQHVPLEDMHSLLVDTITGPLLDSMGIMHAIIASAQENPAKARIRLLMYMTDTWFANNRLYTVLMLGSMVASGLDFELLKTILIKMHALIVKALTDIAETAKERFESASYRVLSHMLNFESISMILKRQYHRNDGHVDETSLQFNSSYWMNIYGYYERLTNSTDALNSDIRSKIYTLLHDVVEVFCGHSPKIAAYRSQLFQPLKDDEPLGDHFKACFNVFSVQWDTILRVMHGTTSEPAAKRQRLV